MKLSGNKFRKVRRLLKNGYSLCGKQLIKMTIEPITAEHEPIYCPPSKFI
jgi:hypothetical protein